MPLTPIARRRATAVLILVAALVVVCFATGNGVVAAVLLALTPAVVYRVTGNTWQQAFAWALGQQRVPTPDVAERRRRSQDRRPGNPVPAVAMLVVGVPAGLGLLSALGGWVIDDEDAALAIGIVMTLTWTGFAGLLSGMVVRSDRQRQLVALAAGAMTVVSVLVAVPLVFGS